jgi:Ca-activated chloride channel family protein
LNESLLQQIAGTASGFYLPLSGTDSMNTLYERGLAPLPRGDTASRMVKSPVERYQWPLGLGILLIIAELFISDRRHPKKGETKAPAPLWQTAIFFLLAGNSLMAASASTARNHYDRNEFDEAYQEYRALQEDAPDDPRLKFNAGAAAYESGKFGEAIQQFKESLRTTELELQQQGYYNVANSMFRQGASELFADQNNMDVAIDLWTESVKNFKSAIQLNPQDQKAAHNKAFVEKKLMDLKKKKSEGGQDKNKGDQKDPNKGNNGDEQNQQGKGDQENDQGKPRPGDDSQGQQQGNQRQDQQQNQQGGSEQEQPQQAQNQGEEEQKEAGDPNDQVAYFGQMTAEQAKQLLDAQRGEEKAMLFLPQNRTNRVNDPRKNW